MEQFLSEPVELTETELQAVAGGDPFGSVFGNTTNSGIFTGGQLNANANALGSEAAVAFVELNGILSSASNFLNG